jgi:hypothetical protein
MRSRLILVAVGAAMLAPAAFAQTWEDRVSITTVAKSVGQVVAELSKVSGLAMSVNGLAANDIVFVSLKDVSVQVAADKIAAATGSRWVEENGVFVLTRNASDERRQWDADARLRKTDIEWALSETVHQMEQAQEAANGERQYETAGVRAIINMLRLLPSEQLAGMEPNQRIVFSSRSTAMQRSLPSGATNVAREYITEDVSWHVWSIQRMRSTLEAGAQTSAAILQTQQSQARLASARIGKILLIVQNEGGQSLIVRLNLLDPQGKLISNSNLYLPLSGRSDSRPETTSPERGEPLKYSERAKKLAALWRSNPNEIKLQLSGLTIESFNVSLDQTFRFEGSIDPDPSEQIDDDVRALAARPDTHEPLDYFVTEMLQLSADAKGAGVVACIPDSAMQPSAQTVLGAASANKVWADLAAMQMSSRLEDGIYVVSPKMQSLSRYERMNRTAVAQLVAIASKKGYASLDDLGHYATNSSRGAFTGPLDSRLISIAHPEAGTNLQSNGENQEALAIFAALGHQRRLDMIANRKSVLASGLGVMDDTRWLTYNSADGPILTSAVSPSPLNDFHEAVAATTKLAETIVLSDIQSEPVAGSSTEYQERTELLPNGLPSGTTVRLIADIDTKLRASENQDQTGRTTMLTAEQLGAQRAQRDAPAFADSREGMPEYRAFTMAEEGDYTIIITYADNYTLQRSLVEVKVPLGAKPVGYSELPAEVRKRIEESYKSAYNSFKNMKVGDVGGGGDQLGSGSLPPP